MATHPGKPLPPEFLDWQVKLRLWTMEQQHGAPHAGVAPLVVVRAPGVGPGTTAHSIICGILPRQDLLEQKTKEFRELYESGVAEGARAVYDRGIEYLKGYYSSSDLFDKASVTTLLAKDSPLTPAVSAAVDKLREDGTLADLEEKWLAGLTEGVTELQ